jgi:putative RecB family exonuclease
MERLSVSRVQAYLACSLQYRFRYVDHVPQPWRVAALAFGSSIHAAVEYFHRERLARRAPTSREVVSMFDADWYAQNTSPLVFREGESSDRLSEAGRALLAQYVRSTKAEPECVEQAFEVELVDPESGEDLDVRLIGALDLVERDGTVVDLKTAAKKPSAADLEQHLQLSTYALVTLLRTGRIPPLRLDVLLKTKDPRVLKFPTQRDVSDLSWTAELIRSVAQAIRSESFHPSPSWRCTECEFFAQCQAWRG